MSSQIESNPLLDRLPPHLKQFIKPQNYDEYTAIDQAVWRYVMRKNIVSLSKVAHKSYLKGLEKTGISIDEIPSMYGMNRILKEIGWAAVAVDGFIPPNAFMEFQAYNILVIASDIRQLENIEYTPAPDIIHEAAGHAPIIANPDYAEYLRRFGKIGCKAISSKRDYDMYDAVRTLSILKESPDTDPEAIKDAENRVNELQNQKSEPSEMALIRNLHWWTVEYGLIGTVEDPKIYGAGLLSSIGESEWCMTDNVEKLSYTPDAAFRDFDITKPQPQLFVTPDFAYLCQVLEEFADTMALRKGGHRGLAKLIESQNLGTIELSTGLQISGVFTRMIKNEDNEVIYFETEGPTALSFREKELIGQGIDIHPNGFRSPLGKLKGINLAIENMSPRDLKAYNFYDGEYIEFEFESGITIAGINITGMRNIKGELILIQFKECTIKYQNEYLFKPEWGTFDLAVGKEILSAFSGPADDYSFDMITHNPDMNTIKRTYSTKEQELHSLYQAVKNIRNGENSKFSLESVFDIIKKDHSEDWLLSIEIYELVHDREPKFATEILNHLDHIKTKKTEIRHLIDSGIKIINQKTLIA
ncbi:aromatic amino acid hydroxylase [Aquimarina sp. MMG015]|uniref:aromatic amino acid hydroxylase n=1 Tax=Aquimarina TaxID=290174 RepID=UPI000404EBD8|nr:MULTISPECIES: aromatic amino acid hydroxylase [Aquimarina]AXT56678.1 aromatic amino acid hydroxylase [Aquimarina sp. AD1]MBQ4802695.1 aromatic amino acid hydroxylase [Aquimarina sp. MMG015]RKN25630.1 aromatic amino acid hydroxylase [Aquimarina sp. AD1]